MRTKATWEGNSQQEGRRSDGDGERQFETHLNRLDRRAGEVEDMSPSDVSPSE